MQALTQKLFNILPGMKTVKTTMDIYAQVKYNKPEELLSVVNAAFAVERCVGCPLVKVAYFWG